jgi:hypothetical protein
MAALIQLFRGTLLALAVYPFRSAISGKHGWLKLFALLWVLTGIGAVITGPGSIEGMIYTRIGMNNILVGFPEITFQMAIFAIFFTAWIRRPAGLAKKSPEEGIQIRRSES